MPFCMGGPQQSVLVKSLGTAARLVDGKPSEIRLLGYEGKVEWKQESEGFEYCDSPPGGVDAT